MDTTRLSEVEYAISSYFIANFLPIMKSEKDALQSAQAQEIRDHSNSFAGFMQFLAQSSNPNLAGLEVNMGLTQATSTGTALKKTDEDYVVSCLIRIANNDQFQSDLARLAAEWRNAVVAQVGRAKYNQACEAIGGDLALAYVDHRIEQLMIDKMVQDRMPRSSFEYVIRKGASQSLLGLNQWLLKSPLSAEIEARGEMAYKPSNTEKWVAKGVTFVNDSVTLGGFSSWGALVRTAGFEVGFQLAFGDDDDTGLQNQITVEDCISQGVFGYEGNIFKDIVADSWKVKSWESPYLLSVNETLKRKIPLLTEKPFWDNIDISNGWKNYTPPTSPYSLDFLNPKSAPPLPEVSTQSSGSYQTQSMSTPTPQTNDFTAPPTNEDDNDQQHLEPQTTSVQQEQPQAAQPQQEQPTNEDGWGNLLASVGLDGIGDLGKNLGYVMAMLPDLLFGFFTGNNRKFNIGDNLMPLASILLGLFVKNPILRMVFIGMGGANLLNKAGHEAMENASGTTQGVRYKQYADEALDPRITSPAISGNALIANIDRVPYSISLPQNVIDAYHAGALPLNTLANAVLRQHDQQQAMAQNIYNQQQNLDHNRNIQIR